MTFFRTAGVWSSNHARLSLLFTVREETSRPYTLPNAIRAYAWTPAATGAIAGVSS